MLRTMTEVPFGPFSNLIRLCLPASRSCLNIAFSAAYLFTSVLPADEQACIAG
jgi:hypothetical protein